MKSNRNPETIGTGRVKEKYAPRSTDRAYIGIQTCLCVSMRVPLMNVPLDCVTILTETNKKFSLV